MEITFFSLFLQIIIFKKQRDWSLFPYQSPAINNTPAANYLLCTNQSRTQRTHLYGIDSCWLADGQTDAALREWSRGDEPAISGVDTDGGAVLSTFDEKTAIFQAEGHVLWLVCAEIGNVRLHVENVKQSFVHVNLPIAIRAVGIVERWVWLGASMRQHVHDLFGGECGIGL